MSELIHTINVAIIIQQWCTGIGKLIQKGSGAPLPLGVIMDAEKVKLGVVSAGWHQKAHPAIEIFQQNHVLGKSRGKLAVKFSFSALTLLVG